MVLDTRREKHCLLRYLYLNFCVNTIVCFILLKATQCNVWVKEMTERWICCHSWPFFFREIFLASEQCTHLSLLESRWEGWIYPLAGCFLLLPSFPSISSLFSFSTLSFQCFSPRCLFWHQIWIWFPQDQAVTWLFIGLRIFIFHQLINENHDNVLW